MGIEADSTFAYGTTMMCSGHMIRFTCGGKKDRDVDLYHMVRIGMYLYEKILVHFGNIIACMYVCDEEGLSG